MRSVFIAPSPLEGYVFIDSNESKMLITNDTFAPSSLDESELEQVAFDTSVQSKINNLLSKVLAANIEISTAMLNYEGPEE